MANVPETKIQYTTQLFELRKIQLLNAAKGIKVEGLQDYILKTKTAMSKEEIAWVEQMISELESQ